MDTVEEVKAIAKDYFTNSRGSHRWDHTLRVLRVAEHIAKAESADLQTIQMAALLHDIGRAKEDQSNGEVDHAILGAKKAEKILKKLHVDGNKTPNIIHCIETHRFRGTKKPASLEAKILFDADKIDSIGAVGIGRAFLFAGEVGAKLHDKHVDIENTQPYTEDDTAYREYLVKLSKIKDRMLTNEGRRLAKERHQFMVEFFNRLNREIEGEL